MVVKYKILLKPVLVGVGVQLPLPSMNRLNKTEPETLSIFDMLGSL
jgi:hypothetical protein